MPGAVPVCDPGVNAPVAESLFPASESGPAVDPSFDSSFLDPGPVVAPGRFIALNLVSRIFQEI